MQLSAGTQMFLDETAIFKTILNMSNKDRFVLFSKSLDQPNFLATFVKLLTVVVVHICLLQNWLHLFVFPQVVYVFYL